MTETKIQMRFADVDRLGHVNNVNLMHYYDLGKNDYFERTMGAIVGFEHHGLITAATNCSYLDQVKPGENIAVRTKVVKVGNKSFSVFQQVIDTDTGKLKSESTAVMVTFDFFKQESIPIPDPWREALLREMENYL